MTAASLPDGLEFLSLGGEMGARIRAHDWEATPFGVAEAWPESLRTALGICLGVSAPSAILWGSGPHFLYNDAWGSRLLAEGHPGALGKLAHEVWPETWHHLAVIFAQMMEHGDGAVTFQDSLPLLHGDRFKPAQWKFSSTPIRGENGHIAGVLKQAYEITARAQGERRASFLLSLSDRLRVLDKPHALLTATLHELASHLNVSAAGYARMLPDGETLNLDSVYNESGEHFAGQRFQPLNRATLDQGRPAIYPDFAAAPEMAESQFAGSSIRALLAVPIIRQGALRAVLYLADRMPRAWTADDVNLAEDVASRLWEAVERSRIEEALREEGRALQTLNQLGREIAAELDIKTLIQTFIRAAAKLAGAAYVAYFEKTSDKNKQEAWSLFALTGAPAEAFTKFGMPGPTALFAPTFQAEGVVRSGDVTRDARYGSAGGMPPGHMPVRSYLAVPVVSRAGERLGALLLGSPEPDVFGEREEHLITGLAGLASVAIDNARLFQASQNEIAERDKAQAALRELNDTLEDRIAEHTEALMLAEEQLRHSQKMEAVGQLTGGIAHDFNNLLTGISGSLELLNIRLRQGRAAEAGQYISTAQGAAQRAAALTHRLLAFSRRQTLDPKSTDIGRLIADMEEMIHRSLGPSIELEVVGADAGLWHTFVDPHQLENALVNLCVNARDAMPNGGRVVLETVNKPLDKQAARLCDLTPGEYVLLSVSDNGTGMTPEVASRAFDPFFTTKPLGEGTGLGLSMIYGFARQSGGQARIYSEPGEGSTICIYLPRYIEPDQPETPTKPAQEVAGGAGQTVLIVDDEPTVRMLLQEVLTEQGYEVLEAANGATGLEILRSNTPIDLLISDVGLPGGMNGRQLADAARVFRPSLKVLFITGYAENAVVSHGHLSPGMHVMTKPFAMEALAARIGDLLAAP